MIDLNDVKKFARVDILGRNFFIKLSIKYSLLFCWSKSFYYKFVVLSFIKLQLRNQAEEFLYNLKRLVNKILQLMKRLLFIRQA